MELLSPLLADVCRHCDTLNEAGAEKCLACGQSLEEEGLAGPGDDDKTVRTESDARPVGSTAPPPVAPLPPSIAPVTIAPATIAPATLSPATLSPASRPPAASVAPPHKPSPAPASAPDFSGPRTLEPRAALPPGALPPGWAASPAPRPVPAPTPPPRSASDGVACPNCRSLNPPGARFCGSCGFGLVPAPAQVRGKLVLIRGLSGGGRQFPLAGGPAAAGRTSAIGFPEDPYVAPLHATFFFHENDLVVRDEGAPNGIYVRLREPQPLHPGDMFSLGEHLLRYGGVASTPGDPARYGGPRTSDRFHIIEEILEGGAVGRICRRSGPVVTIGRAGCDLSFPTDGFISGRHVELAVAGETPFLKDVGSANGTFVRVPQHSDRVLRHGDYLLLGRELLRVEVSATK